MGGGVMSPTKTTHGQFCAWVARLALAAERVLERFEALAHGLAVAPECGQESRAAPSASPP